MPNTPPSCPRSFTWNQDAFTFPPRAFPSRITFDHFAAFSDNPQLLRYLVNSALVATITAVLSVIISAYMAYSFAKFRYRGRRSLMQLVLASQMFPQALLLITLYALFSAYGLLNSYLALIISFTTFTLPLCVWMLKGFFDGIPPDLEEASRVDGSTRLGALIRIVLPLARPGIAATTVFIAIGAWNEYLWALLLTTADGARTWPVGLQLMVGEFQMPWGVLSASGIISIIPIIIGFAIVQRALVSGLMAGGVKG